MHVSPRYWTRAQTVSQCSRRIIASASLGDARCCSVLLGQSPTVLCYKRLYLNHCAAAPGCVVYAICHARRWGSHVGPRTGRFADEPLDSEPILPFSLSLLLPGLASHFRGAIPALHQP